MEPFKYVCNREPQEIVYGFTKYFDGTEFDKQNSDSKLFTKNYGNKPLRLHDIPKNFIGYTEYNLGDYIEKFVANHYDAKIIKCPRCGTTGELAPMWRVKCNTCDLWLECDKTKLYSWGDLVKKVSGYFGTTYYHNNEKITLDEYNMWAVYYRLEKI